MPSSQPTVGYQQLLGNWNGYMQATPTCHIHKNWLQLHTLQARFIVLGWDGFWLIQLPRATTFASYAMDCYSVLSRQIAELELYPGGGAFLFGFYLPEFFLPDISGPGGISRCVPQAVKDGSSCPRLQQGIFARISCGILGPESHMIWCRHVSYLRYKIRPRSRSASPKVPAIWEPKVVSRILFLSRAPTCSQPFFRVKLLSWDAPGLHTEHVYNTELFPQLPLDTC